MTPQQAIDAALAGTPIHCTPEEYPTVRIELHKQAQKYIEVRDPGAILMLKEMQRLDIFFRWGQKCG